MPLDAFGKPFTSDYGYVPTRNVCEAFVVLFTISTRTSVSSLSAFLTLIHDFPKAVVHLWQTFRYRAWWLLPTVVLAGLGEAGGWAARHWSSYSPLNDTPYLIQCVTFSTLMFWIRRTQMRVLVDRIVCLIIAPTPLVGAIFISFGQLTTRVGQHYSRLSTRLCECFMLTLNRKKGLYVAPPRRLSDLSHMRT